MNSHPRRQHRHSRRRVVDVVALFSLRSLARDRRHFRCCRRRVVVVVASLSLRGPARDRRRPCRHHRRSETQKPWAVIVVANIVVLVVALLLLRELACDFHYHRRCHCRVVVVVALFRF
jgi:hypothetical protein